MSEWDVQESYCAMCIRHPACNQTMYRRLIYAKLERSWHHIDKECSVLNISVTPSTYTVKRISPQAQFYAWAKGSH